MTKQLRASNDRACLNEAYSNSFLKQLTVELEFDALAPKMVRELRSLGARYFADVAIFADDPARAERREEFRRLKRRVADFSAFLNRPEYADIASDMYFAALRARAEPPKTNFPQLTEFEKTRGAPYIAELFRLLRLLQIAADDGIKHLAPPRGRKRSYPVENFARRAAYVWTEMLGRPFTLDHHQGSGTSRAFQFVKTLLSRLDPDISDAAIVTAMRKVVAELGTMKSRRKGRPDSLE